MLNAQYTIRPVPGTTNLVDIGITPKSLIKLSLKMTAWSILPYAIVFGACYVPDLVNKKLDKGTPLPETD